MPSTIIDSTIFGDLFSTPAMRQIWSDTHRTACYLQIEAALARVQGRLGLIPAEAADEIDRVCSIERIDMALLKTQTERIGYPVLGVVSQINSLCRDQLGEYCHWGATTQDITDTATVLQIRAALDIVHDDLRALGDGLARLAREHRDTPMIGRSIVDTTVRSSAATNTLKPTTARIAAGDGRRVTVPSLMIRPRWSCRRRTRRSAHWSVSRRGCWRAVRSRTRRRSG